jgi:hypothetical protein
MAESQYARTIPGGRTVHLVRGEETACGLPCAGSGWARWPASLMPRTDLRPLCKRCVVAARSR